MIAGRACDPPGASCAGAQPQPRHGEPSALPIGVELPPAIRADLLDPALWQDGLAKYARATNLAVALADASGRLIGSTINPRPTWSLLHAKASGGRQPPDSSSHQGADAPRSPAGCPFSLAPHKPCNCVADALAPLTLPSPLGG